MQKLNHILIDIKLENHQEVKLHIFAEKEDTLFEVSELDAQKEGEERIQLLEGCFYEYELPPGYFFEANEVVTCSKVPSKRNMGRLSPNIYVGTLTLYVCKESSAERIGKVRLEVQSLKADYRSDYRHMLEEITEYCTDLLMQVQTPILQKFTSDFDKDAKTLYQKFAFIKSIVDTDEFNDAIHKIASNPVTHWTDTQRSKDIRSVKRITNAGVRQILNHKERIPLPEEHQLSKLLNSVPSKIQVSTKKESLDTPENRFVKHALQYFAAFCMEVQTKVLDAKFSKEVETLIEKFEQFLSHSMFKEISHPNLIPLNSPVLQRKEGYREVLRVWLMFDLAAKLAWQGGDDVYEGGKRDVAVLYEYWLFFKLMDLAKEVFGLEPPKVEELIEATADGLALKLKQGRELPIRGIYETGTHKFEVQYSYNRTFGGNKVYPKGGSWTREMRPDYTFSIWPYGITAEKAEEEELMVHVHFDAKYKVENLGVSLFEEGDGTTLKEEKTEERKGTYKRADLLKMHAYKDAIRRTVGAYILYPGSVTTQKIGYHDILPGLGAFALSPSKNHDGTFELKSFLLHVVEHLKNKASQRERLSFKTYEIHKDNNNWEFNDALPPTYHIRGLLPQETHVLIGFCKSQEQHDWITNQGLYNLRTGTVNGSIPFNAQVVGAKYLLLHFHNEGKNTNKLYQLKGLGPRVFSKADLLKKGYPSPSHELYLVFDINPELEKEFEHLTWDITQLQNYRSRRESGKPFTVTMEELMRVVNR